MLGRKRSPIALDFGEHSVKVLQLERRRGGALRVRDARYAEIDAGPDAGEPRRQRVVRAARRALQQGSFRGRAAISALRLADVTTRHIRVPQDKVDDHGRFLASEIRDHPGHTEGELSFCAIPVTDLLENGTTKREYLCCIADAQVVQEHMETVEQLGLVPTAIDLETCAQVRPFVAASTESSFLNVDLGCHSSRITIVRGGVPVLMRAVPVGGSEMARTLSDKLDLDVEAILDLATEEDARHLQISVTRALAEQLDLVLGRIADCVRYCASLFQGRAVSPLRVIGSISSLPGLATYLGRRVGIKAEVGDPFAALGLPFAVGVPGGTRGRGGSRGRHGHRTSHGHRLSQASRPGHGIRGFRGSFATALGLALRGVPA